MQDGVKNQRGLSKLDSCHYWGLKGQIKVEGFSIFPSSVSGRFLRSIFCRIINKAILYFGLTHTSRLLLSLLLLFFLILVSTESYVGFELVTFRGSLVLGFVTNCQIFIYEEHRYTFRG